MKYLIDRNGEIEFYEKTQNCCNTNDNTRWIYGSRWNFGYDSCIDDKFDIGKYFEFKFQYFQENLYLMMIMGAMYGVLRLIGAIGLLKNRMWGFVLSVINCTITIALMMFLLPAGIMDGILAGTALVLILMQYYGDKEIVE